MDLRGFLLNRCAFLEQVLGHKFLKKCDTLALLYNGRVYCCTKSTGKSNGCNTHFKVKSTYVRHSTA